MSTTVRETAGTEAVLPVIRAQVVLVLAMEVLLVIRAETARAMVAQEVRVMEAMEAQATFKLWQCFFSHFLEKRQKILGKT